MLISFNPAELGAPWLQARQVLMGTEGVPAPPHAWNH